MEKFYSVIDESDLKDLQQNGGVYGKDLDLVREEDLADSVNNLDVDVKPLFVEINMEGIEKLTPANRLNRDIHIPATAIKVVEDQKRLRDMVNAELGEGVNNPLRNNQDMYNELGSEEPKDDFTKAVESLDGLESGMSQ